MPTRIGIIGCGNICGIYLANIPRFKSLELAAVADLLPAAAQARAAEAGCPAPTVQEILDDPSIDIVLNLTIPKAHFEVSMRALEAGKHVYCEKPLGLSNDQARGLLETARKRGLRVGCAPDTFLGGAHQTCRKLIDDGWIGEPVAADAFMLCHGHESWHPSPVFYYEQGGGPLLDMGPYYLTALVNLMGPVRRVTGSARVTFPRRRITSQPLYGQEIQVQTPTHISGVLDFANGAVGTLVTSFDTWACKLPCIEVHGTLGSMIVPDPNGFGGAVQINIPGRTDGWKEVPLAYGFQDNSRGIGLADMAEAIAAKRPHRASGALAGHVLETMLGILDASERGAHVDLASTCEKPALLPADADADSLGA